MIKGNMVNLSKGVLISSYIFMALLGVICGLLISIKLFAIDVDLLAVPYLNKGVKLTKDITIEQNELTINIPKGARLILSRRMPSSTEYCILINSYWDEEDNIDFIENNNSYFELKRPRGVH